MDLINSTNNKPIIRINFTDFWSDFDKKDNYFIQLLSPYFNLKIVDEPDFLFYSVFGKDYLKHKGIRILYTGENVRPNFNECDFALSFDYNKDPRNYRLPICTKELAERKYRTNNTQSLFFKRNINEIIKRKTKFCGFLVNNPNAYERIKFFKKLSKYKKIDSGAKVLRNIDSPYKWIDPIKFLNPYKFNICFENTSYSGYTTEKLTNAMLTNCIPIYWGDPLVGRVFNTKSFVNIHDYSNFREAIDHIIEIDNDEALYRSYLKESYVLSSEKEFFNSSAVVAFFTTIFQQKDRMKPVATYKLYPHIAKLQRVQNKIQEIPTRIINRFNRFRYL